MLRFAIFGFPVQIQPFFWLICFFCAGGFSMTGQAAWFGVLTWMIAIFISILWHELGHAMAVRRYQGYPVIALHGMGGTTFFQNRFDRPQRLVISGAGPLGSLLLAGAAFAWRWIGVPPFLGELVFALMWINIVWTVFNLLPILPMDGGQILRDVLGPRHYRLTCIIGMLTAIACALVAFFLFRMVFATVLLGFMAYANGKGLMDR
jgi:Zn-dependent protease